MLFPLDYVLVLWLCIRLLSAARYMASGASLLDAGVIFIPIEAVTKSDALFLVWGIFKLKFPAFPYATMRSSAVTNEFRVGLPGLGQTLAKSSSRAAWVMSFLTSENAKCFRLLTA